MHRRLRVPIPVLLLLGLPLPAMAQAGGAIAGTITEVATGAPVVDAAIQALADGVTVATTASNDVGRFRIEGLDPGDYEVRIASFAFQGTSFEGVPVVAGETTPLHVRLSSHVFVADGITVSASRKRETLWEAPARVAVVDSQALRTRPAVTPVDHLNTVTGVDQIRYGLQSSNVVTRGFNNLFSGALHTLTDYRIASVPSLQVNLLHLEPATNEDLERMEVVLGPGAALYGPNTANGVLHMMTRSPLDHPGTRIAVTGGERDVVQGSFRTARRLSDVFGIKVSGQYVSGREWEFVDPVEEMGRDSATRNPTGCRAAWLAGGVDAGEAGLRCDRVGRREFDIGRWAFDVRSDWRPGSGWDAVFSTGLSRAADGIELTGIGAAQAVDWTKYYVQARAGRGRFFGQAYMNASHPGDTYLLQNGASIRDRSRLFVSQLQHGFSLGRQSFTYGVDYLRTVPDTDATINGRNEDDDGLTQIGGYLQSETALTRTLDLVLAGRLDHTSALEDPVFSPRAALVLSPAPGHSLRATWNRAVETPSPLNMFLDIHAGGVPDPTLAGLGYGMRAQGPGFDGIGLVGPDGVPFGMRSPFNPGGAGQLLPADPATLWQLAVGLLRHQEVIDDGTAAELLALDASGIGINAFDPNTQVLAPLAEAGVRDVPRMGPSRQSTFEIGYKGLLAGQKLLVAADAWYTEKSDFISPLIVQTPFLLLEGAGTVQMLVPYFMGKGLTQEQGVAQARQLVEGDPARTGDGIAEIPLAVASSPDVNAVGADMLVTFRNFGRVSLWGADLAATLLLGEKWSLHMTGSYVSDDHFRSRLQGTEQVLALNAPTVKGSSALRFRDATAGLDAEARVRYHNAFAASSAGYTGLACVGVAQSAGCVEAATLTDLTVGYRLPGFAGASVQLTVQNVFDAPYRSFVRVPAMGRLALVRLAYEF